MDIQITLDHFAIITYITDYMLKYDTGTMEFIKKAIKETENQTLRERLKVVKNTLLTHRQIGEAEAFYKLIPYFKLSDSNCGTLFVHTGFRHTRSRFLKNLTEAQVKNIDKSKLITLPNKPGQFYLLAESMEDRYDKRPAEGLENLENLSLSQFAKRCTLGINNSKKGNEEKKASLNNGIKEDFIIAFDEEKRTALPKSFQVGNRLRRPLALRFHKFNKTNDPHQYYFSQLRLYHPQSPDDLEKWESSLKDCLEPYEKAEDSIKYVKSKVMKYQDKVDEAQVKAQEEFDSYIGDMLDRTKEQQEADCVDEGTHEPSQFMAIDPDNYSTERNGYDNVKDGYYKMIELDSLDYLCEETRKMDCA